MDRANLDSERLAMKEGRLFKLLARNLAIGVGVALLTVAGLVISDAQGLRGLLMNDQDPLVGVILLTFGFVITLGSAAMGTAIMALPRDDDRGGRGTRAPAGLAMRPVPVRAGRPRRTPTPS